MRQSATDYHFMGSEPGQLALLFLANLMTFQKQHTGLSRCLDQKLQRTGLGYKSQAALMFSCKFSVPLMEPVAAIPTCSSMSFFWGWMTRVEHNTAEKVTPSETSLTVFLQSVTWLIHSILWLTRGSGLSYILIISNLTAVHCSSLSPEEQVGVSTTMHNSVAFSTCLRTPGFHYTGWSMYLKFLLAVAYICWCCKACFVLYCFSLDPEIWKHFCFLLYVFLLYVFLFWLSF